MKNNFQLQRVLTQRSGNMAGAFLHKERQPISTLRARIQLQASKARPAETSDFMQVVLNGVPFLSSPADQVEVFLPDGTRLVVTGEKSIRLISSILKSR
jgi:hypothetical protein